METTINKMMAWYAGQDDWNKDIPDLQLTNSMIINGVHAQENNKWGEDVIELLFKHKDDIVNVTTIELPNVFEHTFEFNKNIVVFDSITYLFSTEEC